MTSLRIVCLSDTHGLHGQARVPDGDLLLHAGDLTGRGREPELLASFDWLRSLPHPHKVVIAGNHDFALEHPSPRIRRALEGLNYLRDEAVTLEGLTIYGSPWQPWFYDWAFNLRRGPELQGVWARIPEHTDILITHGPPLGICDRTERGEAVGCADLLERVRQVRPKLHLFGHIHEAYGSEVQGETLFLNACLCDLSYRPCQPPFVVLWDGQRMSLSKDFDMPQTKPIR